MASATISRPSAKPKVPASATRELARRELTRRRLVVFAENFIPRYTPGWVHEDICSRLERFSQDVIDHKSPRLMLLVPPRHGKSALASISFPAWHLGKCPTHEVINVGYNLELPMKFSRAVRDIVREPSYQAIYPEMRLNQESQSVEEWMTTKGGGYKAAGVGGGITGKGAHVLIIDDPIKNQEESDNIDTRQKLEDWYQSTAYTRLAPGGGVLLIECMTGDTPVMMADGTHHRMDILQVGDEVATYRAGLLTTTIVTGWKSSGRDLVYRITTSSGRIVRANGRHPFLTHADGELIWTRTHDLTMAHTIVALPGSGVSGRAAPVPRSGASCPSLAVDGVYPTTTRSAGLTGIGQLPRAPLQGETPTSSTGTASPLLSTMSWSSARKACARFVARFRTTKSQNTGKTGCASTTTTSPGKSEDCSATTATSLLDIFELNRMQLLPPDICDFILDPIVSVETGGEEEVFDLQIEGTENFIACGLVSHNTWWNDDDLAGRFQRRMEHEPLADQFEVVKYPALAEKYEYRNRFTHKIERSIDPMPKRKDTKDWELLREPGEALHPERYDAEALLRVQANMAPRIWSALYQQNPVPEEGMYFRKEYIRLMPEGEYPRGTRFYCSWDFAIGEKKQNDWTVGVVVAHLPNDTLWLCDMRRFRGDAHMIMSQIIDLAVMWMNRPDTSFHLGFEDGQIFKSIEPTLIVTMRERQVFPSYERLKPLTDKLARANPLQGRMQHGRFFFVESKPWIQDVVHEFLRFPAGAHDDIVDAVAWATRMAVVLPQAVGVVQKKPVKSWKEKLKHLANLGTGGHMSA